MKLIQHELIVSVSKDQKTGVITHNLVHLRGSIYERVYENVPPALRTNMRALCANLCPYALKLKKLFKVPTNLI